MLTAVPRAASRIIPRRVRWEVFFIVTNVGRTDTTAVPSSMGAGG